MTSGWLWWEWALIGLGVVWSVGFACVGVRWGVSFIARWLKSIDVVFTVLMLAWVLTGLWALGVFR